MGACFQAPHATPSHRPMETWAGLEGPFIAPYNINDNNDNNKNNNKPGIKNGISFRPQNYMVASFQAPCATPGQRQMETHHVH